MASSFTTEQLRELKKISLARILCDNLDDVSTIQRYVMRPPTSDDRSELISFQLNNITNESSINNSYTKS